MDPSVVNVLLSTEVCKFSDVFPPAAIDANEPKTTKPLSLNLHTSVDKQKRRTCRCVCRVQGDGLFKCPECSKLKRGLHALEQHVSRQHSRVRLPCAFCSKVFRYNYELNAHLKQAHYCTYCAVRVPSCTCTCCRVSCMLSIGIAWHSVRRFRA